MDIKHMNPKAEKTTSLARVKIIVIYFGLVYDTM